jgi:hypothetical protein
MTSQSRRARQPVTVPGDVMPRRKDVYAGTRFGLVRVFAPQRRRLTWSHNGLKARFHGRMQWEMKSGERITTRPMM